MAQMLSPEAALRVLVARHETLLDLIAKILSVQDIESALRATSFKIKYIADVVMLRFIGAWQERGRADWMAQADVIDVSTGDERQHVEYRTIRDLSILERQSLLQGGLRLPDDAIEQIITHEPSNREAKQRKAGTILLLSHQQDLELIASLILEMRQPLSASEVKFLRHLLQILSEIMASSLARRAHERDIAARDEAQRSMIRDLANVICQVSKGVLLAPIVGPFDEERIEQLTTYLLERIHKQSAHLVILDLTGVSVVTLQSLRALPRIAATIRLLGANAVVVGLQPQIAQDLNKQGITLGMLATRRSLGDVLAEQALMQPK